MTRFTRQVVFLAAALAISAAATTLWAEVEVTLKTGASLVGKVKIDGADAVVTIGDSEMRVPLAEVDTIAAADAGPERQAHRLLLAALGAQQSKDDDTEVIGLLAEATRLAPDDPHIAFWYASSLADAGYGQAASDILSKQRDAISKAYPGMIDQLVSRIKRRVAMESMPPALVERVDALNAELAKQSPNVEVRHVALMFRLVDPDKQPIERSAFQIQSNGGQDENLESFDDGYFLYTFNRHRNNQEQPSKIDVAMPGLEAKSFDADGSTSRVRDAGELVVKRFDEAAKIPFRVNLVDPDKKPIVGARVTLQPMSSRGGTGSQQLESETDAEGWAEVNLFPMRYSYHVQAEGFNPTGGQVDLKPGGEKRENYQQMFRAIRSTIRLAWESTSPQGGGKTSGEATLNVGDGSPQPYQYGQNDMSWLRPIQQKDQLTLQFADNPFGFGGPFAAPEAWVRVVPPKDDAKPAEAEQNEGKVDETIPGDAKTGESANGERESDRLEEFNALDLDDIDKLKAKLPQPKLLGGGQQTGPRPPMVLAAEAGKIFVGRVQHRDNRTGQPIQLAFKVFVEEMGTGNEADE